MKTSAWKTKSSCFAAFALAFALFSGPARPQEQKGQAVHYTVTDLGLVGPSPGPLVITNDGLIAESIPVSNAWHAAISFLGQTPIDLAKNGGLGGPNSGTFGVNELGQAAGEAETESFNLKEDPCGYGTQRVCVAFLWQNGVMGKLPLLKDENGMAGRNALARGGINIRGQAAGVADNTTLDSTCPPYDPASLQYQIYQFKPVIWTDGEIAQLPTAGIDAKGKPFNDPDGVVFRINDSGLAVGATGTCTSFTFSYLYALHATLWKDGSVIDLGNLGGTGPQPPLGFGNFAYYVNSSGQVVGTSDTSDGLQHAFFWSPETLIQDVGTIPANGSTPADVASVGLSINDLGDIGGVSFPAGAFQTPPTASPRAFIRPKGGTMVDLNSLIPQPSELYLFSTCSINSLGEIIGLAVDTEGNFHGYLAIPDNSAADSSAELSAEAGSSRFAYAWQVLRDRFAAFRARPR
jgi:probable HAF family extracellular repeat protein